MKSSRYYTAPVPKMPAGIIELMDGLARDVLKNNPPDVYQFCADHMKKLLQIRNETKKPNSTAKQTLTVQQKITLAKKVIHERAALRREIYDKNMQNCNYEIVDNNDKKTEGVIIEPKPFNVSNVIKILEVDLSGNLEHEIVVNDFKINEDTPLLQETEITNTEPIAIVNKENVNDFKDNNQQEILVESNKPEFVNDEVTEENLYKFNESENSVQDLVINIENVIETTPLSESADIDVTKIALEIEDIKDNIECSDEKIENNDSLDSNKKQNITSPTSPKTEGETNVSDNENDEIRTVEELNITVTYNPEKTDQTTDNVTSNIEMDTSNFVINNESLSNSEPGVQVINSQNNEITMGENNEESNDIKDHESSTNANELNKQPFSEIYEHEHDEDNRNYQELVSEVNNTSMDLETAAITIQKVFRSFLFRNKTLSSDEATNVDINLLIEDKDKQSISDVPSGTTNKDRRALGLSRIDTVLQTVNEEKSLSLSTDDSSTLSSAATIIQAHVRGFLVRNKLNWNKANSSTSGFDSDGQSTTSFEVDNDCRKNKTILNIHIVPEGSHFMSRDESMLTSIDLSVDGSPRDSTNLHPMGYDTSERRKQLKREDAIQSISPPSNNSGKQSVEADSVKEILEKITEPQNQTESNNAFNVNMPDVINKNVPNDNIVSANINDVGTVTTHDSMKIETSDSSLPSLTDEMDVVTPFAGADSDDSKIIHSGEFHDVVLPTKVTRTDTSVVREFQNVLVYFLLWNNA